MKAETVVRPKETVAICLTAKSTSKNTSRDLMFAAESSWTGVDVRNTGPLEP